MKAIDISCGNCGETFQKIEREHKRQLKNNKTRFFCSRTCSAIKNNEENPRKGNPQYLSNPDNKRDEYTPFRWFILRSQYRNKKNSRGCDLTVEFLKQLWDQQKGICPFTNWQLIQPFNSDGWLDVHPANASLDRIDNSLGYVQGNVRFICVMANYARHKFTDEQLIEFCQVVANKVKECKQNF